jgi:putative transposase
VPRRRRLRQVVLQLESSARADLRATQQSRQSSGAGGGWNANSRHHYHLGCGALSSATLADSNKHRPLEVFSQAFGLVASQLDRQRRNDGQISTTPITICHESSTFPTPTIQRRANCAIEIIPGATLRFRKRDMFITNGGPKSISRRFLCLAPTQNIGLRVLKTRPLEETPGDGFRVLADGEVALSSKGESKLPIPMVGFALSATTEKFSPSLRTTYRERPSKSAVYIQAASK